MAPQAHQPEPSVDIPLQSTSDPRTRYSTDPGRENDVSGIDLRLTRLLASVVDAHLTRLSSLFGIA
jgi:hypothetical protein